MSKYLIKIDLEQAEVIDFVKAHPKIGYTEDCPWLSTTKITPNELDHIKQMKGILDVVKDVSVPVQMTIKYP